MQISHYKHISFPGTGNTPAGTNASDDTRDAATGTPPGARTAAVHKAPAVPNAPGVIATIQSDATGSTAGTLPADLVYAKPRKPEVRADGVPSAKAAQSEDSKAQDFVTFAVHAMREYADAQAHQKTESAAADDAAASAATSFIPRSMGDVQKLAARFKLFA